ncbi:hypothetical protein H5T87_11335, partial [bacterium]|nr:hypothetical protein [bacterium]
FLPNTDYVITVGYYIVFTGAYPPSPSNPMYRRVDGSISITIHFENLIVNAQPEYLINNPGGDNHNTTITFQLSSAQKKYCTATISIYSSAGQLVKQETLNNLLCPGTYTYQWDGKIAQGTPPVSKVAPSGIYPYDIEVLGASPYDTDSRCSKNLKITQTKAEVVGGLDDCSSWDGSSPIPPLQAKVSYVLEDATAKNAYSAKITVFNKSIQNLGEEEDGTITNLPGTTNPVWNQKTLNIELTPQDFPYIFLVSAVDDYLEMDKAHRRKTALQKNSKGLRATYVVVIDEGHGGGDIGNNGSEYWDPIAEDWIARYSWNEEDATGWMGGELFNALSFHNLFHRGYIYEIRMVPRVKDISVRAKLVRSITTSPTMAQVFVSLHGNSYGNGHHDKGSDNFVIWRYESRGDLDLANCLTYWLRLVGICEIGSDLFIGRSTPILYKPSYNPPRQSGSSEYPKHLAVLNWKKTSGTACAGCLVEAVTLINYEDEDYVMPLGMEGRGGGGNKKIAESIHFGIDEFVEGFQP